MLYQKIIQECAKIEVNNRTLERRTQAAKKEVSQAISSKAELEDSLKCTNKELDRLRDTLAAKEEWCKNEAEQLAEKFRHSQSQFKKQLAATNAMLVEEQAKTKDIEHRCLESQEHALKQIADLSRDLKRDDNSDKLLTAQDQIIKFENTCSNLQNEVRQLLHSHQAEVQRLQHACESCHNDLNLVLLEKNENEKMAASERMKLSQKIEDLEESERLLLDEKMKLSRKIEDMKAENNSLERKVKCKGALCSEVERYKEQLSKEKRRSEAYKGKAIEAHNRSVKAKEVLDSLCS